MTTMQVNDLVLSHDQRQLLTNYAKNYLAVKQLEKEMKAEVAKIKEVMVNNNVKEIENGEYRLTLSEVKGFKQVGDVPEEFTKVVLDTAKVGAHVTLTGNVPDGVERTITYKLNAPKEMK